MWVCTFFYHYGRALGSGGGRWSNVLGYAPTALVAGIGIAGVGYDHPAIQDTGLLITSAGIGGLVLLGTGWTARVEGLSARQHRWAPVLVIAAPVAFWV